MGVSAIASLLSDVGPQCLNCSQQSEQLVEGNLTRTELVLLLLVLFHIDLAMLPCKTLAVWIGRLRH